MKTKGKPQIEDVVLSLRRATETNLKLQQEMLLGWTRYWPGFTGRRAGLADTHQEARYQWSRVILGVARSQRELLETHFDAVIASFDMALGFKKQPEGAPMALAPPAEKKPRLIAPVRIEAHEIQKAPETQIDRNKNIYEKVAIVTGAASGIGAAVARELANRGARAVYLVDRSEDALDVAASINDAAGRNLAVAKIGDTIDEAFRRRVFNDATEEHGLVTLCIPAAGITRDALSVRANKLTGKAEIYPLQTFREVTEVNLLAPIYWCIEMVARIADDRRQRRLARWEPEEQIQGVVLFLGSVASQGNKGQIAYATAKAGLEGAAATLTKEAMYYGVRCAVLHPGFTDTPMVRALGEDFLKKHVLPYTQLRRLIHPEEIADAICFMISNSAVSGELWADAGWHPQA